jgi:hypothetical protein
MAGALHKWMAQRGSHDTKIHDEEEEEGGEGGLDVDGEDHDDDLKHQLMGTKPFDISQEHASLLGLGDDRELERGQRHTGNESGKMHPEHAALLGLDDDDDYC